MYYALFFLGTSKYLFVIFHGNLSSSTNVPKLLAKFVDGQSEIMGLKDQFMVISFQGKYVGVIWLILWIKDF